MFSMTRRWLSTQPWGALVFNTRVEEVWPPIRTVWVQYWQSSLCLMCCTTCRAIHQQESISGLNKRTQNQSICRWYTLLPNKSTKPLGPEPWFTISWSELCPYLILPVFNHMGLVAMVSCRLFLSSSLRKSTNDYTLDDFLSHFDTVAESHSRRTFPTISWQDNNKTSLAPTITTTIFIHEKKKKICKYISVVK